MHLSKDGQHGVKAKKVGRLNNNVEEKSEEN
jgi:hypothetical protein